MQLKKWEEKSIQTEDIYVIHFNYLGNNVVVKANLEEYMKKITDNISLYFY